MPKNTAVSASAPGVGVGTSSSTSTSMSPPRLTLTAKPSAARRTVRILPGFGSASPSVDREKESEKEERMSTVGAGNKSRTNATTSASKSAKVPTKKSGNHNSSQLSISTTPTASGDLISAHTNGPSNPTPWRHSAELPYVCRDDWPQDLIIEYLCRQAFSIPPREGANVPLFQVLPLQFNRKSPSPLISIPVLSGVLDSVSAPVYLPKVYRVPLLFVAKFQWESLRLVLTSQTPQQEWDEFKYDIVHLSRLCQHLFDDARDVAGRLGITGAVSRPAKVKGATPTGTAGGSGKAELSGVGGAATVTVRIRGKPPGPTFDKTWRSPMFNRVLTRFYRHWFLSRDKYLKAFFDEFEEEEYETDVLKYDWARWALKGHKGFALTKDEIQNGISAKAYMSGLGRRDSDGTWVWGTIEEMEGVRTAMDIVVTQNEGGNASEASVDGGDNSKVAGGDGSAPAAECGGEEGNVTTPTTTKAGDLTTPTPVNNTVGVKIERILDANCGMLYPVMSHIRPLEEGEAIKGVDTAPYPALAQSAPAPRAVDLPVSAPTVIESPTVPNPMVIDAPVVSVHKIIDTQPARTPTPISGYAEPNSAPVPAQVDVDSITDMIVESSTHSIAPLPQPAQVIPLKRPREEDGTTTTSTDSDEGERSFGSGPEPKRSRLLRQTRKSVVGARRTTVSGTRLWSPLLMHRTGQGTVDTSSGSSTSRGPKVRKENPLPSRYRRESSESTKAKSKAATDNNGSSSLGQDDTADINDDAKVGCAQKAGVGRSNSGLENNGTTAGKTVQKRKSSVHGRAGIAETEDRETKKAKSLFTRTAMVKEGKHHSLFTSLSKHANEALEPSITSPGSVPTSASGVAFLPSASGHGTCAVPSAPNPTPAFSSAHPCVPAFLSASAPAAPPTTTTTTTTTVSEERMSVFQLPIAPTFSAVTLSHGQYMPIGVSDECNDSLPLPISTAASVFTKAPSRATTDDHALTTTTSANIGTATTLTGTDATNTNAMIDSEPLSANPSAPVMEMVVGPISDISRLTVVQNEAEAEAVSNSHIGSFPSFTPSVATALSSINSLSRHATSATPLQDQVQYTGWSTVIDSFGFPSPPSNLSPITPITDLLDMPFLSPRPLPATSYIPCPKTASVDPLDPPVFDSRAIPARPASAEVLPPLLGKVNGKTDLTVGVVLPIVTLDNSAVKKVAANKEAANETIDIFVAPAHAVTESLSDGKDKCGEGKMVVDELAVEKPTSSLTDSPPTDEHAHSEQSVGLLMTQCTRAKSLVTILLLRDLLHFLRMPGRVDSRDQDDIAAAKSGRPTIVDTRALYASLEGEEVMTIDHRLDILAHAPVALAKVLSSFRGEELGTRINSLDNRLQQQFEMLWKPDDQTLKDTEKPRAKISEKGIQTVSVNPLQEVQTQMAVSPQEVKIKLVFSSQEVQTLSATSSAETQSGLVVSSREVQTEWTTSSEEVQTEMMVSSQEVQTLDKPYASSGAQTLKELYSSGTQTFEQAHFEQVIQNPLMYVSQGMQTDDQEVVKVGDQLCLEAGLVEEKLIPQNITIQTVAEYPLDTTVSQRRPSPPLTTPNIAMVDLTIPLEPPPPKASTSDISKFLSTNANRNNPTAKAMMSVMRNIADILEYTTQNPLGTSASLKGKGREMTFGDVDVVPAPASPVVDAIVSEFRAMKDELRLSQQRNHEEQLLLSALHRSEVAMLKDELRSREDRRKEEVLDLERRNQEKIELLQASIRMMEKDKEERQELEETRISSLDLMELRRRMSSLETRARQDLDGPGSISQVSPAPSQFSESSTRRQSSLHPLSHLLAPEYDEPVLLPSPVGARSFVRELSTPHPGTPVSSYALSSKHPDGMDIDPETMPLPIKSQRKIHMMMFPRPSVG